MSKHRRVWNASIYEKFVHEGRGQGTGMDYNPWIHIQDFPSLGMVSRVPGTTTGRVHHLMSNLELSLFYLLDWSDDVLDIREQYPLLDLNRAIEIAEEARIRYPYDAISGFPYVMTSDFIIEKKDGISAIAVKPASELKKPRVREKLEIERRYWASYNVKWGLVTENEINRTKARNIEWLSQAKSLSDFGLCGSLQIACISFFLARYSFYYDAPGQLFLETERQFNLDSGMGLNIYKHLIYLKQIHIDINEPIELAVSARKPAV